MLQGTTVVAGGTYDRSSRYFAPTIVYPADWSQPIMASEIFGPILPVLTYADLDATIEIIKRRPRSLAAYVFSNDKPTVDRFVHGFSFGGGCVNQTMLQCVLSESLPFGGVGASGLGRYYGKYGFDSLSHMKSIVSSPSNVRVDVLLPPYTPANVPALGEWLAPPTASEPGVSEGR
jgi:aldehyde dehydrogenase (NAD+)